MPSELEDSIQARERNHTADCKRAFLRFDPDCPACTAIKEGRKPRMTRAQAYAMLVKKGYR